MKFILRLALLALALVALVSCGGSGSSIGQTARLRYSVYWGERSRTVIAPSSALSAKLVLTPETGDAVTDVQNRPEGTDAVLSSYLAPAKVAVGPATMKLTFYAEAGGTGTVVGTAVGDVRIDETGTGIGTVTTMPSVTRVEVSDATLYVSGTKELTVTPRNAKGDIVALSPGSIFAKVESGGSSVSISGTTATGVAKGTATVVATVDQVSSAPATLRVLRQPIARVLTFDGMIQGLATAVSGDGVVVVGNAQTDAGDQRGFFWTETHHGFLAPLGEQTQSAALGVSEDGSVIVGASGMADNDVPPQPVVWRSGGAAQRLTYDSGTYVGGVARQVNASGAVIVGALYDAAGLRYPCVWIDGSPDLASSMIGELTAVSADGRYVAGYRVVDPTDKQSATIGIVGSSSLRFQDAGSDTKALSRVNCLDSTGQWAGGDIDATAHAGIWSATTGCTEIPFGGDVTLGAATYTDGRFGGGGADVWIAFLYDQRKGYMSYRSLATALKANTGFDLIQPFEAISYGPMRVSGMSADGDRIVGVAHHSDLELALPFVVDFPEWWNLSGVASAVSPATGTHTWSKPAINPGKFGWSWKL